jgi:hypothetical protein
MLLAEPSCASDRSCASPIATVKFRSVFCKVKRGTVPTLCLERGPNDLSNTFRYCTRRFIRHLLATHRCGHRLRPRRNSGAKLGTPRSDRFCRRCGWRRISVRNGAWTGTLLRTLQGTRYGDQVAFVAAITAIMGGLASLAGVEVIAPIINIGTAILASFFVVQAQTMNVPRQDSSSSHL